MEMLFFYAVMTMNEKSEMLFVCRRKAVDKKERYRDFI